MALTRVDIDLKAIAHNFQEIQRLAGENSFHLPTRKDLHDPLKNKVQVLAVVKADAYGHGMQQVAKLLLKLGATQFAVSDVKEGVALREMGIKKPILLLESPLPGFVNDIIRYDLTSTVCTWELVAALEKRARAIRKMVSIHINVDTGMGRLGVRHEDAFEFIKKISVDFPNLSIEGIYTHFPSADVDRKFTNKQIKALYDLVINLDKSGLVIPYVHAANSMGLADYRTKVLNLVRPGLMIYGLYPHPKLERQVTLKPAMIVKSKIIFIKNIIKGQGVSYGRSFVAKRRMTIATIPIGYNDGYLRALSNRSFVLIDGRRCSVLGRVTMDQIVVDVSAVKNVKLGDEVVVLGRQKGLQVSADHLAHCAGTINYEIVCGLGNRLPREYLN